MSDMVVVMPAVPCDLACHRCQHGLIAHVSIYNSKKASVGTATMTLLTTTCAIFACNRVLCPDAGVAKL